jgi:uncharacterized repeat protein (TIGR03803 family)
MQTTCTKQPLALVGFAPSGKPNHTYCDLKPPLQMLAAALGKLSWGKRAWAVLVLWAITTIALPGQTLTTLFSFDGTDGEQPGNYGCCTLPLIQGLNGELYGATSAGGAFGGGTVFKITRAGALTTLYSFCAQGGSLCTDGYIPESGVIQSANGDLYGVTGAGGANDSPSCSERCGTVFRITPSGALTTLYSFCGEVNQWGCADGNLPSGLIQTASGDFYGTTYFGGAFGGGTVFKITPSGALTTLYSFCAQVNCNDGVSPNGLIQAANGDFYGTTNNGGTSVNCIYCGTVYKITPSGALTTLYNFCTQGGSLCTDGEAPDAELIHATDGNFYGTTSGGGASANCTYPGGCGTIFKITPSGALTTLYSFCMQGVSVCTDGYSPSTALSQGTDGNLYGTTYFGSTLFKITLGGTLTTLYDFCSQGYPCPDGFLPAAPVFQDTDGSFYGTTLVGGADGYIDGGTIWRSSVGLGPFVETQTASGEVGEGVKILGTDLTGATSVTFNGTATVFEVASPSLIVTKVPTGATSGRVSVVTPSGTLTSNVRFRVLP